MKSKKLIVYLSVMMLVNNFLFAQQWTSNGSTIYYNGGSIGIGTTTPRTKVDIWNGDLVVTGTDMQGTAYVTSRAGNAYFGNNTYSNGISISPGGNVGIGTSFPGNKLHVEGQIVSTLGSIGFVQLWNDNAIIWKSGNSNGGMRFGSANDISAGGWSEKMRILDNGNIGIGTVNANDPSYKLFVETGIHTRKVKVDPLAWADYVFDKNYQLRAIEQVEQYIRENNHLPEVPSANEVANNGIDLGENQAVLLKKIEELTLYVIEQNKRIALLETEMKKNKKE